MLNKLKPTTIIRLLLTIGIISGIYFETGPFTTLFAVLVSLRIEINDYLKKRKHTINF